MSNQSGIQFPLKERVLELKFLGVRTSQRALETWAQTFVSSVLEFTASRSYVTQQKKSQLFVSQVDSEEPILIVNICKLGSEITPPSHNSNVRWHLLTNGYQWTLIDTHHNSFSVLSFDLRTKEKDLITSDADIEELSEHFSELNADTFEVGSWEGLSEKARALTPEILAEALHSEEALLAISSYLNNEHGQKLTQELISEKLDAFFGIRIENLVKKKPKKHKREAQPVAEVIDLTKARDKASAVEEIIGNTKAS